MGVLAVSALIELAIGSWVDPATVVSVIAFPSNDRSPLPEVVIQATHTVFGLEFETYDEAKACAARLAALVNETKHAATTALCDE